MKFAVMKMWNLKTKLISIYLGFIAFLSIFIYSFSVNIYNQYTANIEAVFFDYTTSQISTDIAREIREYKNLMAEIAMDKNILALFQDIKKINTPASMPPEQQSSPSKAVTHNRLMDMFANYSRINNYITSVAFVDNTAEIILYQRFGSLSFVESKINNKKFIDAILNYGSKQYLYDVNIIQAVTLSGSPDEINRYLYFTYPAIEPVTKESYGVIALEVDNKALSDIINLKHGITLMDRNISPYSCITNGDGLIIFSSINENIGRKFFEISHEFLSPGYHSRIKYSNLDLNLFFEQDALQKIINQFRNNLIVFIVITLVFFSAIIIAIIDRLMSRSEKIAEAIGNFRKTRHMSNIEMNPNDEVLFAIAGEFNMMAREIENLLRELQDKNIRIQKIKDLQRHAEIQALQAQINPHFLYNALDHINWVALENDQNEISHMLSELGNLLRYSISDIDTLVPLNDELNWMKQYVFIQGKRFEKNINLILEIDAGADKFPIYKMLLQPLVENSILHGFIQNKIKNAEIKLQAHILKDGRLEINLSDNGYGMDEKTFELIQDICRHAANAELKKIGLSNVVNRLWYYYGELSEIKAINTHGKGAWFRIIIPLREPMSESRILADAAAEKTAKEEAMYAHPGG
jgi:two-component system sensor histidine kinase YesM